MADPLVLVTDQEYVKAPQAFAAAAGLNCRQAPGEEAAFAQEVRETGCRAVIVGVERYEGELYDALTESACGEGAVIARFGVGSDSIDKARCRESGIYVTNTPGVLDASVAEHAVWLMGALARRVAAHDARLKAGRFEPGPGTELNGLVLLVAGFGAIGRRVATIAGRGLGMRVVAADVLPPETLCDRLAMDLETVLGTHGLRRYSDDLDAELAEADVVSIHMPSIEQTRHFFRRERFARMKSSALLVNTARGPIVREADLFDALSAGRLGGAALDVFENEPYRPVEAGKDLRTLENVVLTPHVGSNTHACNRRMAVAALRNVSAFFAGDTASMNRVE
jgi:lactate dehydrogenase-like 2-hydroxyacid dehydrogenase